MLASSTTIAPSGRVLAIAAGRFATAERTGLGLRAARTPRARARCPPPPGRRARPAPPRRPGRTSARTHDLAAVRDEVAAAAGVGEERHRRRRAREDEGADPVELLLGLLGQVGEPSGRRDAGARLHPRREGLGEHPGAGRGGDPARGLEPGRGQRRARRAGASSARRPRRPPPPRRSPTRRPGRAASGAQGGAVCAPLRPRHVGRQDQRRDLPAVGLRGAPARASRRPRPGAWCPRCGPTRTPCAPRPAMSDSSGASYRAW